MSNRDVPLAWVKLLEKAGFTDPRNGKPSMNALAEKSHVHTTTISAMMHGTRRPKTESVDAIADALAEASREDKAAMRVRVRTLVWGVATGGQPFAPHPDANLLDPTEQAAVNELIRLLALPKKQGGGARDDGAAPNTPGGDGRYVDIAAYSGDDDPGKHGND